MEPATYASVPQQTPSATRDDRDVTDSSTDGELLQDVCSSEPAVESPATKPASAQGEWGTQLCIAALSAISGFLFGYDLCVMVVALPLIQKVEPYCVFHKVTAWKLTSIVNGTWTFEHCCRTWSSRQSTRRPS